MSIQHVVVLGFEPELDQPARRELVDQVRSWPEQIGGFEVLRLGPPISTERARGFHFLLHMVLPDHAALDAYQVHPAHRRFVEWVRDHGGTVLAFDYVLDETTVVVAAPATS